MDGESYVQSSYLDPATTTVLAEAQTLTNRQNDQSDTTSDTSGPSKTPTPGRPCDLPRNRRVVAQL